MGYTAPAAIGTDVSVNEVLTALKMNSHWSDNIRYLHGDDGTIALVSSVAVAGQMIATLGGNSQNIINALSGNATLLAGMGVGRTAQEVQMAVAAVATQFFAGSQPGDMILRNLSGSNKIMLGLGTTPGATLTSTGLGVATTAPLLPLDVLGGGIGHCGAWSNSTTITGAQTILAAGSVTVGITAFGMVKWTGSASVFDAFFINVGASIALGAALSGSATLYTDGVPNTLSLQVSAGGAVTIARTAGTGSYDVSLMLFWR